MAGYTHGQHNSNLPIAQHIQDRHPVLIVPSACTFTPDIDRRYGSTVDNAVHYSIEQLTTFPNNLPFLGLRVSANIAF